MKRNIFFAAVFAIAVALLWQSPCTRADEPAKPTAEEKTSTDEPADVPAAAVKTESESADTPVDEPSAEQMAARRAKSEKLAQDWPSGLERGRHRAQLEGKPLLVRAGASWCPWCDKLADGLDDVKVKEQLKRFTLVYVDVDESAEDVRALSIGPIPALRVLSTAGKVLSWHDGYLEPGELARWLGEGLDGSQPNQPEVLSAEKELQTGDVDKLVKLLAAPDAAVREAALRRLMARPDLAAQPVVEAFATSRLATRLPALELLAHWHAPVAGLDPWRPETITPERIEALKLWTEDAAAVQPPAAELSAEALKQAEGEIARLSDDDDSQASARIEQLARHGAALRPLVLEKLKEASSDRSRARLMLLRYRLAATDALALGWPGGLARLADSDVKIRHRAASELVERATTADEPLLLELFADDDPLIREISLRGLSAVGTDASSSVLVKLLDDPQPNVRAAVLKQLAESPNPTIVPKITAYLEKETDPDLVVHGIRVLKEAKVKGNLVELLKHESWQVRAEAAEALGELTSNHANPNQEESADVYAALIAVLADSDPFVVSRAVQGLKQANLAAEIEPLAKAAAEHPEMAGEVIEILTQNPFHDQSAKVLRGYLDHADPKVRAAVIGALLSFGVEDSGDLVERGLSDPESDVRIATAKKLLELCGERAGIAGGVHGRYVHRGVVSTMTVDSSEPIESPGIVESIFGLFFGGGGAKARVTITPMAPQPADAEKKEANEDNAAADDEMPEDDKQEAKPEKEADTPKPDNEDPFEESTTPAPATPLPPAPEAPAPDGAEIAVEELMVGDDNGPNVVYEVHEQATQIDGDSLEAFRSGNGRPEWMNRAVAPLEKMLEAESNQERLAAAVALVAFGHDEQALPVLRSAIAAEHKWLDVASGALVWLPWDERIKLLADLLAEKPSESDFATIAHQMILRDPDRGIDQLWKLLGADDVSDQTALSVGNVILQTYREADPNSGFGNHNGGQQIELPDVKPYAKDGTLWQKEIALSRLIEAKDEAADELAQAYFDQPGLTEDFHRDAFQLLLMANNQSDAEKLAIAQIDGADPAIRRMALKYLALGPETLVMLRGQIYNYRFLTGSSQEAASTEAPQGLTVEQLQPLLSDDDRDTAASAACLLALLGDSSGMLTLEITWRGEKGHTEWNEALYRAIAALDDEAYVPLLGEINKRLGQWEKRKFYWTIRTMHGPAVLKLRKQIRDEVGMDNLR